MPQEKEYKVRPAFPGGETAEMTLPTAWTRYHRLKFGDKLKTIANGVLIVLPPNISKAEEDRARRFIEGEDFNKDIQGEDAKETGNSETK